MKATTHTEVYRRFDGRLRSHPLRFLSITSSALRVSFKKKLPLVLLYAPAAILCIVSSFLVYSKFSLQSGQIPFDEGVVEVMVNTASTMIEVNESIIMYVLVGRYFTLLVIAWYGAGLVSEDRRLGAHLLYFSRPITRLDYLLGKLLAGATFGALALVVGTIVICATAAFASPNWSFVTEEGDVILGAIAFSSLWVLVVSTLVLCVSSLVPRKTLALVVFFGWIMLTEAVCQVLGEIMNDDRFFLLGILHDFEQVGPWIFGKPAPFDFPPSWSLGMLAVFFASSLAVLVWRLRRMEVVA